MGSWTIEVDGLVLPKPIAGHPALELCNTLAAWENPYDPARDYLTSFRHLVVLAREIGLVASDRAAHLLGRRADPGADTPAMRRELDRAIALRTDSRAVFLGTAVDAQFDRVADAARAARRRQRLARHDGGVDWAWTGVPRLGEPVDAVVVAVAELLVSDHHRHVRACAGPGCGWLFLDPGGRRRWCQMAVCGNRAKQARLRVR